MKLRTNYTKPLWIRFFAYFAVYFLIAIPFIYFDVEYFLKPSLDVLGIMTKKTDGDTSLLEKTLTSIKTEMTEKYGAEYTISSILVFSFGLMFGALLLFVRIMMWGVYGG